MPLAARRMGRAGVIGPRPVARTAATVGTVAVVAHGVHRRSDRQKTGETTAETGETTAGTVAAEPIRRKALRQAGGPIEESPVVAGLNNTWEPA